jgi:hypothetical protein
VIFSTGVLTTSKKNGASCIKYGSAPLNIINKNIIIDKGVLMITKEIERYILSLTPELITKKTIFELFNKKVKKDPAGKVTGLEEPLCYPWEPFIVKKGALKNVDKNYASTVGIYIFNMYFISGCFGDIIPYINTTIGKDELKNLNNTIVNLILTDKITTDQFIDFQNRMVWFNNFAEIFIPGASLNVIVPSKKVQALKNKLLKEHKDIINTNNAVRYETEIQKPLDTLARAELKDDPAYRLYEIDTKPSFKNNYRNMNIGVGPIKNIVSGKYELSPNSLSEGIPQDKYYLHSNAAVYGSYSRSVSTQYGGMRTKELFAAMQKVQLDEPGYDCGSKIYKSVYLDKDNVNSYMWRYIKTNAGLVCISPENYTEFLDMTVAMRSPLYCLSENICNYCAGDLFRRMGLTNVGPSCTKVTSKFLNLSLKKMHDVTVAFKVFDPKQYFHQK